MNELCILFAFCFLKCGYAATLFGELLVCGKSFKNLGLSQRQVNLFIVFVIVDN